MANLCLPAELRVLYVALSLIALATACYGGPPEIIEYRVIEDIGLEPDPSVIDARTDFDELRPFSGRERSRDQSLRSLMQSVATGTGRCRESPVILTAVSDFEVCDSDQIRALRSQLGPMAPALDPERMDRFIVAELNGDNERELIVTYRIDLYHERYMVAFLFRWVGDGFRVSYAGNFLEGALHTIAAFGADPSEKSLFFRYQSCTECSPLIFLSVVDFAEVPGGMAFEVTYATDHGAWSKEIEYLLPGMGHSVDATTETRVPRTHDEDRPHLMQFFDMEEGADEWWLFRCRGHRCDHELFENTLPDEYQALWDSALRL